MAERSSSTTNLTAQEQRARLLQLLAKKELETKLAPLSFSQERFWLEEQINPGGINGLSLSVRITGQLNVAALEQSFTEIVRRHEILRTTFVLVGDQPRQSIKSAQPLQMPIVSLEHLPAAEREAEARRAVRAELKRPFDIAHGPLIRATLLRLGTTDHVLILMTQHLVSDAWSLGNLIQELSVLYEAFTKGRPSPLPPLPLQYAEFAQWQREKLQDDVLEHEITYWVKQLSGSSGVLALPYDRPRPLKRTTLGARESVLLPLLLREQLKALAQQEECTLFMVLLAGLQVLLYRYTGQANANICTMIADRTINDVEKLIGLFLNTLVLRADFEGNPAFVEVLRQVRWTTLEAYDHQTIPFQRMLQAVQTQLRFERASLFQVLFLWQNVPNPEIRLSDLTCQRFVREMDFQSNMELSLSLVETPEGLTGYLEYQTDLFDAPTIQRFLEHYQTLLQAISDHPRQRIGELPLLTTVERQQLLTAWNDTCSDYPQERCIHELFADQVAQTPDAIAVVYGNQHLTYHELNWRANQLACRLQKLKVGPDVLVGLCVERSLDLLIGLLGILKAGGAYLPLDPAFPPERLTFMLQDAQVSVVVTQVKLAHELPQHAAQTVYLELAEDAPTLDRGELISSAVQPQHRAYVLYTSGSTGRPKGVQIPHQALTNFLWAMRDKPGLTAHDRLLAVTTLSFDIAGLELYLPLLMGAGVIIADRETAADGAALLKHLQASQATVLQATPATWHMLIAAGWQATPHLKMLCGGEALPRELAHEMLKRGGELWDMYGPTETTIWSSTSRVEANDAIIGIGRPIANTQFYVLDPQRQLVPIGVAGELHIGGAGIARGYLHRSDLTAQRFIPHPFSLIPGARLYCTGDLVRYRSDGNLEFLGRIDHQVKVRGFRIELGEIETALRQHPAIRDTVVVAHEARAGDKQLIAYVVLNNEAADRTGELRSFLQSRLPHYMIPTAFVKLEAFPLTPNGKIDRRALPLPEHDGDRDDYAPPETPAQGKLAEIWSEVLSVERVGIHDNFFELGGHSLLGTQLLSHIKRELHVELSLQTLFEQPTIAALAALIDGSQHVTPLVSGPQDSEGQISIEVGELSDDEVDTLLESLFT